MRELPHLSAVTGDPFGHLSDAGRRSGARSFAVLALVLLTVASAGLRAGAQTTDPGWPRVIQRDGQQLTIYQPQVDSWLGYTNLHFRCAIAIKGVSKQEKFGVVEVDALTVADLTARMVAIVPLKREIRFANTPEPELTALRQAAEKLSPPGQVTTLSLDRVIAYLDPAHQPVQHPVELNIDPPTLFYSATPAILVVFIGPPRFVPVATDRTDLEFALNTNWDLLRDVASGQYFLLDGESWLTAPDVMKGPWVPALKLPPSLSTLPANDNWADARKRIPGKPLKSAPTVFASADAAEMILTSGAPDYRSIPNTRLKQFSNTASAVFLDTGDGNLYFLVAGRWFRSARLQGPWSAASNDLPPDFARIPDSDPAAFVKASVPGTPEARDAVLLASIPTTTTVQITHVTVNVTYSGQPQFVAIPSTTVQYAVNTPNQVFLVDGGYYWCSGGVWYCGVVATGPWSFCTSVPPAIYAIPSSNPNYNVTYVVVQSATPTTVVYSQTAGYSGEYVAANGVLMFGAGMLVGAVIANNSNPSYYYSPYPCHYSYGCGATYHYGYGGYYGASYSAYGPYGGASYSTGYNPSTGTYGRSATAYGSYGSATRSAAYNPYTGTAAAGGSVSTGYGTASRGAAYNPYTGTSAAGRSASGAYGSASQGAAYNSQTGARAAGGSVDTAYGSASRGAAYNPTTGNAVAGGSASGQYGSASGVKTSQGSGAATWDTANSQGTVARTSSGDVYASNGDTVYKKDSSGGWSQNSGSGWETTSKSQAQSRSDSAQQQRSTSGASSSGDWSQHQQSMESQSQARQSGNQRSQSTSQYQRSGGRSSGSSYSGRSSGGRSGGGRR